MEIYKTEYDSPFGKLSLASDGQNIIGLWFFGQKYFEEGLLKPALIKNDLEIFLQAEKWLDDYFKGKNPVINFPLKPKGTEFQKTVFEILKEIPYGQVKTYGEITEKVKIRLKKEKMSNRATGAAIGRNPISIIIPCHRVIGKNYKLTGYAGGISTKARLLELEGINFRHSEG